LAEPRFNGRDHEVANIFRLYALRRCDPGHRLTITAIESKGDTNFLAIVAGQFEAVGAPA
jgi:hypothetical protein